MIMRLFAGLALAFAALSPASAVEPQKVAVLGASGFIGSKIVAEAAARGHQVTAISRSGSTAGPNIRVLKLDIADTAALTEALQGQAAVIDALSTNRKAGLEERLAEQRAVTGSVLRAMKAAGVTRILAVGGAGTLLVKPGVTLFDSGAIPAAAAPEIRSTALLLDLLKAEPGLAWTYLSPSASIVDGQRTGRFRLGGDTLLTDAAGKSEISLQDYAVAMIDELETARHTGQRFTVGY
jgi:putative NADH-flavin reductase